MFDYYFIWYFLIAVASFGIAFAAIWFTARLHDMTAQELCKGQEPQDTAVFLFENGQLVDATPRALSTIGKTHDEVALWTDFATILQARIPSFPDTQDVNSPGVIETWHAEKEIDKAGATVEHRKDLARITLSNWMRSPLEPLYADDLSDADQGEINAVKMMVTCAPYPVWQTNGDGVIVWANQAYVDLMQKLDVSSGAAKWPQLFNLPESLEEKKAMRTAVREQKEDGETFWYDVTAISKGDMAMYYAVNADAIVSAEVAQRNFVQTLTKTFAQLSIGLAIFDRNRRLALFNPALIDLTSLPADFLSARPNLSAFFDKMRENRMIPEPKNYSSWREQIADLVVAASDGRYSETWTLPSGLTYRVTGRPHPDGAVAFLFEDISAEISLTRRFRSELELSHSVLDAMDPAVVVFSAVGNLSFCNQAYRDMWGVDPDSSFADISIRDSIRLWSQDIGKVPEWDRLQDSVLDLGAHKSWRADLMSKSHGPIELRAAHVSGNSTIVMFCQEHVSQIADKEFVA